MRPFGGDLHSDTSEADARRRDRAFRPYFNEAVDSL